jgi:hypothetical protein
MRGGRAIAWEQQLKAVFDRIDAELESRYGGEYPLHPNRSSLGDTGNPEYDGLFTVSGKFTAGFGSEHGAGYSVDLRLSTLTHVPRDVKASILDEVVVMLEAQLPAAFPGRELRVSRDGATYKIHGDLSLGSL